MRAHSSQDQLSRRYNLGLFSSGAIAVAVWGFGGAIAVLGTQEAIGNLFFVSKKKFRTILRRFSDLQDYQELLSPLGVRLSKASIFEFGIAAFLSRRCGEAMDFAIMKIISSPTARQFRS